MSLGKTADQRVRDTTQRNHGVYNPGKNGLAGHSENNATCLVLRDAGTPASLEQPETLGPVIPHSSEDSGDGAPREVKSHGAKEIVHGRAAIVFRRIVGELYDDFATAKERLTRAGVESARPIDWGDHDCLYFLDPDGNLLEVVSYR